jgi:hypothetical protein
LRWPPVRIARRRKTYEANYRPQSIIVLVAAMDIYDNMLPNGMRRHGKEGCVAR